jgi:hypothetical protein
MARGTTHRETDLVLKSLRTFISGEPSRLQAALVEPLDWEAVERIANLHSVMPLVAYTLRQHASDSVPLSLLKHLQERLLLASRSNLALIAEWSRVLKYFQETDISVLSLKGPALALCIYPNFALREFSDLDLLVRPGDFAKARDLLVRDGYEISSPFAGDTDAKLFRSRNAQLEFVHNERRVRVDLHWGAWHEMFPFQLPVDLLFESARLHRREAITFRTLSPENLLLYLCAHGTKHCWLSLRWICDIACHVQRSPDMDWDLCLRTAEVSNCALVLQHSLLMAHRVLGLELPRQVADYCDCSKARVLADQAMSLLFRGDNAFSHAEELRFHVGFAVDWRSRARFLFERLFVPDEPVSKQHLPGSLQFLSYCVKPARFVLSRLRNVVAVTD